MKAISHWKVYSKIAAGVLAFMLLSACATSTAAPSEAVPTRVSPPSETSPATPTETKVAPSLPTPTLPIPTQSADADQDGITLEEDAQLAPFPPVKLTVEQIVDGVKLSWLGTNSDTVANYVVYRKTAVEEQWIILDQMPVSGDNAEEYIYADKTAEKGVEYSYGISVVSIYGVESPITASAPIVLR